MLDEFYSASLAQDVVRGMREAAPVDAAFSLSYTLLHSAMPVMAALMIAEF